MDFKIPFQRIAIFNQLHGGIGIPPYAMSELEIYNKHLPHWRLSGSTYFVTWRLNSGQAELNPRERDLITESLRYFDQTRYVLDAFVIMDDHVHAILTPKNDWKLEKLVYSLKRFTATKLTKEYDRIAPVWQREYYDHIIRNQKDWDEKVGYVLTNPQRRWGDVGQYKWVYLRNA